MKICSPSEDSASEGTWSEKVRDGAINETINSIKLERKQQPVYLMRYASCWEQGQLCRPRSKWA